MNLRNLPAARDLLSTWEVTEVSVYPFGPGWWPFNPSVHRDPADGRWRCVVRCANYTLPGGVPVLARDARLGRARSRNALLDLDPRTLSPTRVVEVAEPADDPAAEVVRAPCASEGLEDLRLFRARDHGLCVVATALQYNRAHPGRPEVLVCRVDPSTGATWDPRVLRGAWSFRPQKNWAPFDGAPSVRLLYAIERGVVVGLEGPVSGSPEPAAERVHATGFRSVRAPVGGRSSAEVKIKDATTASRRPVEQSAAKDARELRGGSQLVALPDGRWLGVAHRMTARAAGHSKFYWHTFFTTDPNGRLLEAGPDLKLSADHGIEFAAGLAVCPSGRVVVSYGTDDHQAWLATTRVEQVLELLRPADAAR